MTQADTYHFMIAKMAEFADYHGSVRVLTDLLKAVKSPTVASDLRAALDTVEAEEAERNRFESLVAQYERDMELYNESC